MKNNYLFKLPLIAISAMLCLSMSSCSSSIRKASSPVYSLTNSRVSNGYLETELQTIGKVSGETKGMFRRNLPIIFGRYCIVGRNINLVTDEGNKTKMGRIEKAKATAMYDLVSKSKCDIILAPIYTIQVEKNFPCRDRFTVKVEGIGANITDVSQKEINPNSKCNNKCNK